MSSWAQCPHIQAVEATAAPAAVPTSDRPMIVDRQYREALSLGLYRAFSSRGLGIVGASDCRPQASTCASAGHEVLVHASHCCLSAWEALESPLPPTPSLMKLQEAWSCSGRCCSSPAMSWPEAAASAKDEEEAGFSGGRGEGGVGGVNLVCCQAMVAVKADVDPPPLPPCLAYALEQPWCQCVLLPHQCMDPDRRALAHQGFYQHLVCDLVDLSRLMIRLVRLCGCQLSCRMQS